MYDKLLDSGHISRLVSLRGRAPTATNHLRIPTWPVKLMISVTLALLALRFAFYAYAHVRLMLDPDDAAAVAVLPTQAAPEDGTE